MAQIYKATTPTGKIFTLKKILHEYSSNQEFIKMFLEEAKISLSLKHPNIIRVLDLGQLEGSYYLAMEYVFGRDVGSLLRTSVEKRTYIPIDVACSIILQCCRALEYAHSQVDTFGRPAGIVHRDISPPNILVSYNGEAKILDFGIAKALRSTTRNNTRSGVLKGKFSYMSPEQASGKQLNHQSDIFALGIVFYELLTSRTLFYSNDEIVTLENVRKAKVSPPSKHRKDIPKALDKIILKALQLKLKSRYAGGADMAEDIRKFLKEYYPKNDPRMVARSLRAFFPEDFDHRKKASVSEGWLDLLRVGAADDELMLDLSLTENSTPTLRPMPQEIKWYHRLLYDPQTQAKVQTHSMRVFLLMMLLGTVILLVMTDTPKKLFQPFEQHQTAEENSAQPVAATPEPEEPAAVPDLGSFAHWLKLADEAEQRLDFEAELDALNHALQINSFEMSVLSRRQFVLLALGQYEESCQWFRSKDDVTPEDKLLAEGACQEIDGEKQKAGLTYYEFLKKFPNDKRAAKVREVFAALKRKLQ